jgi:hypothetical protein
MSSQDSPPSKYDEQAPSYEVILQDLFSGNLTPETAAPKLAAIAIPNPDIDPEECARKAGEVMAENDGRAGSR